MIIKNAYNPKGYKKSELDKPHLHEKLNLIKETEIIKARNIEEAQKKFNEKVKEKFDKSQNVVDSQDFYDIKIDSIDFIDTYEEDENSNEDPTTMFLKHHQPLIITLQYKRKSF